MNTTQHLTLVSASSRLDPSKLASLLRVNRSPMTAYQQTAYRCKYSFLALEPFPKLAKYLQHADPAVWSSLLVRNPIPNLPNLCVEPEVIISIFSHLNSCSSLPTLMIQRPPTANQEPVPRCDWKNAFLAWSPLQAGHIFQPSGNPKTLIQTILDYSNDPIFSEKATLLKNIIRQVHPYSQETSTRVKIKIDERKV